MIIRKLSVLLFVLAIAHSSEAQSPEIASRMLQKMRDSLLLSVMETNSVDSVNKLLHSQKTQVRQQHSNVDSLTKYIQLVERSRDSLYHIVLPEGKYMLYRQKKRNLISNN